MGKDDFGPISQYNSLTDPNLQGYYSKSVIRSHLRQSGLINKKGEIIPEDVWRKKAITKDKMEQASRLIASKIVQQAIEIKNLERAEIRRKLEEVAKRELVRRIRGQSVQNRQLPLLWSNKPLSAERVQSGNTRRDSRSDDEFGDIRLVDDDNADHTHRIFAARPRKLKPIKKERLKKRQSRQNRTYSAYPRANPPPQTILTMIYFGKNVKIPYDYEIFESKDEISIYQQHCGGENLLVYSGLHEAGDKFSFRSRRHKEYPFSLTIYINGTYDCRISTCCEYRHKLNVRIGGKTGRFGFTNVVGDHPCVKCLLEKSNEEKKKATTTKTEQEDENYDDYKPIVDESPPKEYEGGNSEIPVKHENDPDGYGSDFDNEATINSDDFTDSELQKKKDYKWTVVVYTESKTLNEDSSGKEASVNFKIVGEKGSSDVFKLDSMNDSNFLSGKSEKFNLSTEKIGIPTHVVLNFKDKNSFDWVVYKIELIDDENSKIYSFTFNDRIKKNHDIKIALDEDKYSQKKWLVKVYTSDFGSFVGTDAKIYISLIGDSTETDKVWLSKKLAKSKNKDLFERGNIDEFLINCNTTINKLEKIRIGHDNSGLAAGWHLEKVEVIDQKNYAHYYFNCDRWLSKDEDDGKIERVLTAWVGDAPSARNSKLEIKVKHLDDPDSDAELPVKKEPSPPVTPSPAELKISRKSSATSQKDSQKLIERKIKSSEKEVKSRSESKMSKSSRNEFDTKSIRLSANDLMNEINNKQKDERVSSARSSARSSTSSKSKSSVLSDRIIESEKAKEKSHQDIAEKATEQNEESSSTSDDLSDDDSIFSHSHASLPTTKRAESKLSGKASNASVKKDVVLEKTRRLSGTEVEKIIKDEISASARSSVLSRKSAATDSKNVKQSVKEESLSDSVSDSSDTTELASDSDTETSDSVVKKEAATPVADVRKGAVKSRESDHLVIDVLKKESASQLKASSSVSSSRNEKSTSKDESSVRPGSKQSTQSKKIDSEAKSPTIISNGKKSKSPTNNQGSLFGSSSSDDDEDNYESEGSIFQETTKQESRLSNRENQQDQENKIKSKTPSVKSATPIMNIQQPTITLNDKLINGSSQSIKDSKQSKTPSVSASPTLKNRDREEEIKSSRNGSAANLKASFENTPHRNSSQSLRAKTPSSVNASPLPKEQVVEEDDSSDESQVSKLKQASSVSVKDSKVKTPSPGPNTRTKTPSVSASPLPKEQVIERDEDDSSSSSSSDSSFREKIKEIKAKTPTPSQLKEIDRLSKNGSSLSVKDSKATKTPTPTQQLNENVKSQNGSSISVKDLKAKTPIPPHDSPISNKAPSPGLNTRTRTPSVSASPMPKEQVVEEDELSSSDSTTSSESAVDLKAKTPTPSKLNELLSSSRNGSSVSVKDSKVKTPTPTHESPVPTALKTPSPAPNTRTKTPSVAASPLPKEQVVERDEEDSSSEASFRLTKAKTPTPSQLKEIDRLSKNGSSVSVKDASKSKINSPSPNEKGSLPSLKENKHSRPQSSISARKTPTLNENVEDTTREANKSPFQIPVVNVTGVSDQEETLNKSGNETTSLNQDLSNWYKDEDLKEIL